MGGWRWCRPSFPSSAQCVSQPHDASICFWGYFRPVPLSRRRDRRSSTIDEGVEHGNTPVAFLQDVRTGIAERLVRKSAPPTAHADIVHRVDVANHLVAVLRDALTNFQRHLIDRRNADQA